MATVTMTQSTPTLDLKGDARLKCDGTDPSYGDWRDDLVRDGFAVVKGAVPKERALSYANRMLGLLESLYVTEPCQPFISLTC